MFINKTVLVLTLPVAIFSSSIWAQNITVTCPDVSTIKSATISSIVDDSPIKKNWWSAHIESNFNTTNTWQFLIQHIPANNQADAAEKAKSALQTLNFSSGPDFSPKLHSYLCTYHVNGEYPTSAITPKFD